MVGRDDAAEQDYTPERVRRALDHWLELVAAAEGATGSLAGGGSGRLGARQGGAACLIADLEEAADRLPPHWRGTLDVYRLQQRAHSVVGTQVDESQSLDLAVLRMARLLGWHDR